MILGQYPELPQTVTNGRVFVSTLHVSGEEGCKLSVYVPAPAPDYIEHIVHDLWFASSNQASAYALAKGYTQVWGYQGKRLHPPVVLIEDVEER